jgi:acetyl esterase/lipase
MPTRLILAAGLGLALAAPLPAQPPARPNAPKLTTATVKTTEQVFKKTPQGELTMHLYLPADSRPSDKRAVIVFFFGGGWKNGSSVQFRPQAEYFAGRGMVAACADYRIASTHKTTPDKCVEDAKSAVRWLRAHAGEYGIDPDRLVASGGSSGGHLAAAVALVPGFESPDDPPSVSCKPNALVLFNPALDLGKGMAFEVAGKNIGPQISPMAFLGKDCPPAIIFFGTDDRLLESAREFVAKSKELGNRVELLTAAGQPHGFFNRDPWCQATAGQADRFLGSLGYLAGKPTVPGLPNGLALKKED